MDSVKLRYEVRPTFLSTTYSFLGGGLALKLHRVTLLVYS